MTEALNLEHLRDWIGRSEELHDQISAAPLNGLAATLDHDGPALSRGAAAPPLAHWLYFLPQARQSQVGADGHPRRGGFLPPVPLPRRMFAGSRLSWEPGNPLRVGDEATRVARIESVEHKRGRSGEMVFVRARYEVRNARGLCLAEEQDIVYRAAAQPGEQPPAPAPAPAHAPWRREIAPDPVLLFRFSALTFNGHRIHYDRPYATGVEGYPGLVVHGPLLATLLVDLARRHEPARFVRRFEFRAVRPVFDGQSFGVNGAPAADGRSAKLWASDHEGWLAMQASVELE
jgi:3-methylfumaryl-CoA hydratase